MHVSMPTYYVLVCVFKFVELGHSYILGRTFQVPFPPRASGRELGAGLTVI